MENKEEQKQEEAKEVTNVETPVVEEVVTSEPTVEVVRETQEVVEVQPEVTEVVEQEVIEQEGKRAVNLRDVSKSLSEMSKYFSEVYGATQSTQAALLSKAFSELSYKVLQFEN